MKIGSKWYELGEGLALARLQQARERACLLMSDRPAKRYEQTRKLVGLLNGLNSQPFVLESGLKVYAYAKFVSDVDRRPAASAKPYYLPKGTRLAREVINGCLSVTARTRYGARMIMSPPTNARPMVKVHAAIGFVEPTGRSAGSRGSRRGGPAMDKGSNN